MVRRKWNVEVQNMGSQICVVILFMGLSLVHLSFGSDVAFGLPTLQLESDYTILPMNIGSILIPDPSDIFTADGLITGFRFLSAAHGVFQLVSLQENSSSLDSYVIKDTGDSYENTGKIAIVEGNITNQLQLNSGELFGFLLVDGNLSVPFTNISMGTTPSCSVPRIFLSLSTSLAPTVQTRVELLHTYDNCLQFQYTATFTESGEGNWYDDFLDFWTTTGDEVLAGMIIALIGILLILIVIFAARAALNMAATGEVGLNPRDNRKVADIESQLQSLGKPTKTSKKGKRLSKKKNRKKSKKLAIPVYEVDESLRRPLPELKLIPQGRLPSLKISKPGSEESAPNFTTQTSHISGDYLNLQSDRSLGDGRESVCQSSTAGNYDLASELSEEPAAPGQEELGYAQGQSVNEWIKSSRVPPPSRYEDPNDE